MRPVLPLLALAAAAALASGCIVSKSEYLLKSQEAEQCNKKLSNAMGENQLLGKDLSAAQADLAAKNKRLEESTAQLRALTAERDDLKGRLDTANALNAELTAQNEKLDSLLKSKEVSQAQIIQETMDLNKKLRDSNNDLRSQLAAKEGEIRAANDRVAAAAGDRDATAARVAELQKQVDALNRQKDEDLARLKATYDELVGSLKGEIEAGQVQITRMKDRLSVNMVEKILFDSGKAEIKPAGLDVLKKVGDQLSKVSDKRVQIEGHTDNVPIRTDRFPSNWELSAARSLAVVHFLQEQVKMDPTRISAAGYGEYQPAGGNDTAEGKAANRRIEIVLLPLYEKIGEAQEKTGP